jgi:cytochrome c-type biogenesis protein CcmF
MIAQLMIHAVLGCAVASTIAYALGIRRGEQYLAVGRILFTVLAFVLLASASTLVMLILQHRFEFTYVQSYSSINLPLHLKVAAMYSGQEGSFLLWTLLVAIIGVVLARYARKRGYEGAVMTFYGLILVFLGLLLVAKNPFSYVWESYARDGIREGFVPADGRGLNPLLHNAWITIHPPILFTGFASMSVSFAFAMAGLVRREYHKWIDVALPWTLAGTAILGFGIMLGGFWAYETLGWGGFWGWDPVENSSLIPWLVSVALVHTMVIQKRTRGLVKTNMLLAVAAFVMVLYSTFLTRSGILGDTSVHSFVDPGKFAFWILLAFMLTFMVLGTTMVMLRRKDMNINREEFAPTTREFMASLGAALVMASAVMVTIGTSWPVILEIVGQPKVAVATAFYDKVHLILVPAILLVNALSLLLQWRNTTIAVFKRNVALAGAVSAVLLVLSVIAGVRDVAMIVLAASAWFSLVVNAQMGWRFVRTSRSMLGAYVSHLGIGLLMLGVIATSGYTEVHHAILPQGDAVDVAGYTLTFKGREQIERHFTDREKFIYPVEISRNGSSTVVKPVLYFSDFNKRQAPFLEPGIRWGLANDLYIAPKFTEYENVYNVREISRQSSVVMPFDTTIVLELQRFTMPAMEPPAEDGSMRMGAMLMVSRGSGLPDTSIKVVTKITQTEKGMGFDPEWTTLPGTTYAVGLSEIRRNNDDPSKSSADLVFRDVSKPLPEPREVFTVEFSIKPLIGLVWLGVITMVAGFAFSVVRYARRA